jgi:large subunit ribosomal protein L13
MTDTHVMKAKNIKREWHVVDATDKILGRLSVEVARLLMGKGKPNYVPYLDGGDYVVVTNASKIKVSGKKMEQKKYFTHSGYPHGLKTENFSEKLSRRPTYIIEHAVVGMLPKTRLGRQMIKKLKVFAGSAHPYANRVKIKENTPNSQSELSGVNQ